MKDLKSTLGGGTVPVTLGNDGVLKGIIVSNKGDVGRRVGIFTNTPEITVGSKLHSADYRMTSKATTVPDGYLSGREVELAAKKEYSVVFDVEASAPFNAMHKQKSAPFTYIGSASANGLDQAMEYVPYTLKTHTLATPCDIIDNHWFSMTLNLDGTDHHIAINAMKHPAAMTADLNAALAKIHPELRGFISVSPSSVIDDTRVRGQRIVDGQATPVVESISTTPKVNGVWVSADGLTIRGEGFIPQTEVEYHLDNTAPGEADSKAIVKADGSFIIKLKHDKESYYWELMFHVPNTISVSFPRTNYTTRETEGFVSNDKGLGLGQFHITHLNNLLGERHRFHYGEELFEAQALPTDPRLAEAYGVMEFLDNNLVTLLNFGDLNEAGQATVTIPAGHFKFLKDDTRYKAALLMINPSYKGGDFHRLNSIKIAGEDAELFIVERTKDGKPVGSSLIDLIKSEEMQEWVGIDTGFAPHTTDNALYIPEYGAFNSRDYDPEVSDWFVREIAVLIIAPSDGFNGPLFTDTVEDVQVQLEYVKMTHIPNLLYDFNLDVGLETPGDYAKASLEFDRSSMEFDQPIRVEIIYDGVTHEESNFTVDKDDPMGPTLNILTNFQKKRFYESGASNNVTVRVLDEISAEDQVVRTRQMFIRNFNVDVTLPVFSSEIKIEDQTLIYKTTGHPDKYAFTGTYEKTAAAHPDTKQPFYWSKDIVLSASINGEVIESIGCYFTNVEAMGSDVIGELTVEVPPSYIMDSGPGQVTIEVKAVSTTKWDANETVIGHFSVTTLEDITGVEDDITFFTPEIYGADTSLALDTSFKVMDLGTSEVLAESTTLQGLKTDAETRGLVDVSMIYGKTTTAPAPPSEIQCTGASDNVSLEMSGTWLLEVDGVDQGGPYTLEQLRDIAVAHDIEITLPGPLV